MLQVSPPILTAIIAASIFALSILAYSAFLSLTRTFGRPTRFNRSILPTAISEKSFSTPAFGSEGRGSSRDSFLDFDDGPPLVPRPLRCVLPFKSTTSVHIIRGPIRTSSLSPTHLLRRSLRLSLPPAALLRPLHRGDAIQNNVVSVSHSNKDAYDGYLSVHEDNVLPFDTSDDLAKVSGDHRESIPADKGASSPRSAVDTTGEPTSGERSSRSSYRLSRPYQLFAKLTMPVPVVNGQPLWSHEQPQPRNEDCVEAHGREPNDMEEVLESAHMPRTSHDRVPLGEINDNRASAHWWTLDQVEQKCADFFSLLSAGFEALDSSSSSDESSHSLKTEEGEPQTSRGHEGGQGDQDEENEVIRFETDVAPSWILELGRYEWTPRRASGQFLKAENGEIVEAQEHLPVEPIWFDTNIEFEEDEEVVASWVDYGDRSEEVKGWGRVEVPLLVVTSHA